MSRPLFNKHIDELEAAFEQQHNDVHFLRTLLGELSNRDVRRAIKLKMRVQQAIDEQEKFEHAGRSESSSRSNRQHTADPETPAASSSPRASSSGTNEVEKPFPPIDDDPKAILSAWTALEVLSPPSFRRPEDLAGGDRGAVANFEGGQLPWNRAAGRRNFKTYYQIVLGTIKLEDAVTKLATVYADSRIEKPTTRGEGILAVVIVDREGRPIDSPAVSISSFGWGVPRALRDGLTHLANWPDAEKVLIQQLDKTIRRVDDEDNLLSLDTRLINRAFDWLVGTLDLDTELVEPPRFAIRSYVYFKNPEPPEPLLLNSFFLADLATAKGQFENKSAPSNLRSYLGVETPKHRHDLFRDTTAIEAAIAPDKFPPARWPAPGRHSLVLLQQAAVNLALNELRESGILAVNGPPGTGKTTLLRDIAAGLITARAEAMVTFDDPEAAFTHSGQRLRAGNGWLHLYHIDSKLRGFEMLVASSNNKAVENVSAELPAIQAIADDANDLRYFAALSNELLERDTWGLIAAVLGNARNRARFRQLFWWGNANYGEPNEFGLATYLAAASGTPQVVQIVDKATSAIIESRPPRIVTEADAPKNHDDALKRWRQARKKFRIALDRSNAMLRALQEIRDLYQSLPQLAAAEMRVRDQIGPAQRAAEKAKLAARDASEKSDHARAQHEEADRNFRRHATTRPSLLVRLFQRSLAQEWKQTNEALRLAAKRTSDASSQTEKTAADCTRASDRAVAMISTLNSELETAQDRLYNAVAKVGAERDRLGPQFVDDSFFERDHGEKHQLSPWLDKAAQQTRDDVFTAAMALHKAFVDAAAKPLRHNLGALMNAFSGRSIDGAEKEAMLVDLWISLFLVVPVISTTFASVERMLGKLPAEALGWLLIDEAGQALPQAAVGALMRTKRAIVVGDPVQIEPVVVLPDTLTSAVCRRFGVGPDRFNAPAASAQTLADAATPYCAEFAGRQGSRSVGVPLLVHRRCAQPMFGISNAIAYEHLMVHAKAERKSAIRDLLGPSRWIHFQGTAAEKWCLQEGDILVELLRAIAKAGVEPDLYVVTPFVIVQNNLRDLIRDSGVLGTWTDNPRKWTYERVGTVHTVQGREAEAVIFVLGAPSPHQTGARGWAGGRPNLLNVAVSRAKEALYVIGNRQLWRGAGLFRELDVRLPN